MTERFDVWRPEAGEIRGDGTDVDAIDAEDAAVVGAEYYFHNRNGWEDRWPLTFRVARASEEATQDFEVEMEAEPQFYAWPKS